MSDDVQYWFARAVDVPADKRRQFVEANCQDESVRSEVLSLLSYDTEHDNSRLGAVRHAIESVLRESQAEAPARRAGAFELGRLLGSGGMGFVYEGRRVDGEVQQRVAIKFAQVSPTASERFRESAHRRFARERQMLASLRHPYIAGLIDAGSTAEGIPYAVIEQVNGIPIDSYCDACMPDLNDRIRLTLKLCDAVEFAHRNLIVHSDIKPDNVLVTREGIPKLIDFGVATALSEDPTLSTMRAFTPGFASPEQCRGLPPTVATDVYGIGAVLYRLLTGAKPREIDGASLEEVVRSISERDVVRPSAIRPELRGDIENILLKALHREPHRRYGSVQEFADDLNRYLARRPVRATPDSLLYRTRMFGRRHRMGLAVAASLALSLALVTAAALRQRYEALEHAAETRRLATKLLFEVHDEIDGVIGGTRARDRLSELAAQYLEKFGRDYRHDPELAWELLNAYSRLGQSRGGAASSIGDTDAASQFATKTLALGDVIERSNPPTDRLEILFKTYERLAAMFHETNRIDRQRDAVERMLRIAPRLHPLREAQAQKQLARYLDAKGSAAEASQALRRALDLLRTVANDPERKAEADAHFISTLVGYGRAQALAGDFAGAVESLSEAIRLAGAKAASEPQMAKAARQLYWSHIALGDVLGSPMRFSLGRPVEAAAEYGRARAIAQRLVNADPANDAAKLDLSRALNREGAALVTLQPARAIELLDRARAWAMQTSSGNASGLTARFDYLTSSVEPLSRLGLFNGARDHAREARRLADEIRRKGVAVDEKTLLRAETLLLFATGATKDALASARRYLDSLPNDTRPVLSENFATVELLERIKVHTAGSDTEACATAARRLVRIWDDLSRIYPGSGFVRERAEQSRRGSRSCVSVLAARTLLR